MKGTDRAELLAWYEGRQADARRRRNRALRVAPIRSLYAVLSFLTMLHLDALWWLGFIAFFVFGMGAVIAAFDAFVANAELHIPLETPP